MLSSIAATRHPTSGINLKSCSAIPEILPLWVADMDFQPPQEVVDIVQKRAALGVYGYTFRTQGYYDAIMDWQAKRHGWNISQTWIASSPGVVTSLSILVDLLTEPGDEIILQPPVYYPFYDVIRMNERKIVKNPLVLDHGQYRINFEQLEQQMANGARCLLFCSPHNPGGRVWSEEELHQLGKLALRYNVSIISDEIHGDLTFKGHRHIPIASLSDEYAQITATCIAPSKTFNLAGLQSSCVLIPNAKLKRAFEHRLKTLSIHMDSYFGGAATEASYRYGATWLDELLEYLEENLQLLLSFFERELPQCQVMKPQGTYLVWVDCSAISPDPERLKQLMFKEAKVAFNEGSMFGDEGQGFLRINIACPRSILEEGLRRFAEAARQVHTTE